MCQGLGPNKHYEISEIDRTEFGLAKSTLGIPSSPHWGRPLGASKPGSSMRPP